MRGQTQFDPGALNHRLELDSFSEVADGCGGVTIVWTSVAFVWAHLKPTVVRSALEAQQATETATHLITIRHRSDVASGWRFRKGNRIFEIKTVADPDERASYLVCSVEEEGR